jgi:TRAP-type C4-dicarboxylate transport system substrate-binding protein
MPLSRRFPGLLAGAAIIGLTAAGAVDARELSFASGATHNSIGSKSIDVFAETVEKHSGGELTVKPYMQSLLSFMETPPGLRDGMADFGAVLTPYFPSEFPSTTMLTELTMLLELNDTSAREATFAFGGAISEFVFQNCPECLQENEKQNQVFLGIAGSTPYNLLCNKPVRSLEELDGKRVRTGGPQWSRWATELGASPVSMAVNDTYEGLGQGVIDCTAHNMPDLTSFNFIEVVSDITLGVPGGIYGGIGTHMNADAWASLDSPQREAVLHGAAAIAAEIAVLYVEDHHTNMKLVKDMEDIDVYQADQALTDRTRAFIKNDLAAVAALYQDRYNLERADTMIAEFRELLGQWVDKVADVNTREELTKLYWQEAFSNVDVDAYGLR